MSKRALQWVMEFESSSGVWMPRSHWRTLRAVAQFYHEGLGCAFATVKTIANQAGMSSRHLRRTVAELDEMGLVKRNAVQRSRDKSDASNEYELPPYRLVNADGAVRSRIFSVARERIVEQTRLEMPELGVQKRSPWMQFLMCMRALNFDRCGKGGRPVPSGHDDKGGSPVVPVDREQECPGEKDALTAEARTPCPPVELTKDFNDELKPPYPPPCNCANVKYHEKLPDKSENSVRSVTLPKQQSARMGSERLLDGEDAALWEEVAWVMRGCGICPESAGRKLRRAIAGALRLESERSGAAIADVGNLAVKRWQEYQAAGSLLLAPMGVTRFFVEGEWLRPGMWRYDHERLKAIRRGPW